MMCVCSPTAPSSCCYFLFWKADDDLWSTGNRGEGNQTRQYRGDGSLRFLFWIISLSYIYSFSNHRRRKLRGTIFWLKMKNPSLNLRDYWDEPEKTTTWRSKGIFSKWRAHLHKEIVFFFLNKSIRIMRARKKKKNNELESVNEFWLLSDDCASVDNTAGHTRRIS